MEAQPGPHLQLILRIQQAIDAHDLDALVDCFAGDVESVQPVHPQRTFRGADQVRKNWQQILAAVPDLRTGLVRYALGSDCAWAEWDWAGTRIDGAPQRMRGVTIQAAGPDGRAAWVRFFMEPVEVGGPDVESAIRETLAGDAAPVR